MPTDYWSLRPPYETRQYVPKLLAISQIVLEQRQFTPPPIRNQPAFTIIPTKGQLDLEAVAQLAGSHIDTLIELNPGYNRQVTSPYGPNRLLIPIRQSETFLTALQQYTSDKRAFWRHHKVKKGDNLSQLALLYGTSVSAIRRANQLRHN